MTLRAFRVLRDYASDEPAFLRVLRSAEGQDRAKLILAGAFLPRSPKLDEALRAFLADPDPEIQSAARWALERMP